MTLAMDMSQANPQAALQLKDIHLPVPPEAWPPAPGWWLLTIAVSVFLFWAGNRFLRFWRRRCLQKEVLDSLDELRSKYGDDQVPQFLSEISILLRRVAMMSFPHQEVAALTGSSWLSFLDQHGGGGEYSNGAGSVLASGPYSRQSEVDREALMSLARKWVKRNTGRIH